jgi:hypothetical protein
VLTAHPPAAAWKKSLPSPQKPYFREDHFSGGRPDEPRLALSDRHPRSLRPWVVGWAVRDRLH